MNKSAVKAAAVVVHYHPSEQDWQHTYDLSQFIPVLVIDNTEQEQVSRGNAVDTSSQPPIAKISPMHSLVVIENGRNLGVAKALNQGIQYWQSKDVDWCFLFDQDSRISNNFISEMLKPIEKRSRSELSQIAAWVSTYFAKNLQQYNSAIQVGSKRIRRFSIEEIKHQAQRNRGFPVSYAISSGSLINMQLIEIIGLHEESLFIDFVDIEWGLRANAKGYSLMMNTNAVLIHELGDEPIKCFGRSIVNHSPTRHYYYFRNVCHLLKMKHIPMIWKLIELVKLPLRFGVYSLLGTQKLQQIKAMLNGLKDGLCNKKGKKDESTDYR